jgi:hypothetical protein
MPLCSKFTAIQDEWRNYYTSLHVPQYFNIGFINIKNIAICFTQEKEKIQIGNGQDLILSLTLAADPPSETGTEKS